MWKLDPLEHDAAAVAPITAIASEPVVIGRKTSGIADVEQFVNVHKKHAELRADGDGALLVRALGTQPVWRVPPSELVQRILATDGERRLHAGDRLYLQHPESATKLGYKVARGAAAVAVAETAAAAPRAVAAAEAGTLRGRRLSFGGASVATLSSPTATCAPCLTGSPVCGRSFGIWIPGATRAGLIALTKPSRFCGYR